MARRWMKFFIEAGIPKESSAEYAVTFEQNRMEFDMLTELDKSTLRDLNITAMGDIISILRLAKNYTSNLKQPEKTEKEQLLKSDRRSSEPSTKSSSSSSSSTRTVPKKERDKSPAEEAKSPRDKKLSSRLGPQDQGISSRLGPQVATARDSSYREENGDNGASKSVFKRLGSQSKQSPQPEDDLEEVRTNKGIFSRLGPEAEKELRASESSSRSQSPQEARVSSTSEDSPLAATPGKGILKVRGSGAGMSRSKSAPNVINLKKAQGNEVKLKKRISFGKDEIRYMEGPPGIKSRLGFGRCSSPPPPELDQIDNQSLQTELKKIAVGGGKFELRRVMKVVKEMNKSTLRDSVTPERSAVSSKEKEEKEFYVTSKRTTTNDESSNRKLQISIKNDEYQESYNVDKVDLALRAAKLKSNLDQKREEQSSSPKKRLVKIDTFEDGSKRRSYIEHDDPILDSVPVKKSRTDNEVGPGGDKKIRLSEGRTAADFTIVRSSSKSSSSLYSDGVSTGQHKTLAQKADIARSKQDNTVANKNSAQKLPKVSYGRAGSFGNVITAEEFNKMSVKERIGSSSSSKPDRDRESRSSKSEDKSPRRERDTSSKSRDRSPITFSDRSPSGSKSSSIKDRLGGKGDGGKNVYSRLGNRD